MDRDETTLAYLQDRLSPEDRAAFEAEAARDPALGAELAVLRQARVALAPTENAERQRAGWARLSAALSAGDDATGTANDNRWPSLSLVQAAGVVVAAVAIWQLAAVPLFTSDPGGRFVPASETAEGPALQVVFAAGATMAEVNALLSSVDAEVASGPGALGVYRLTFVDAMARDAALDVLATAPALVAEVMAD
ncbi:hypothetical protein JANAI62_05790 [Jannaschia pagri]|uniref:Zinc-finger domain-containing protein n=1 Tax=Jannaschia pagri TaxID=2829797 RepID=A0ABQ4NHT1_9RHOB|nr:MULTISPECIES: hypothetical protein [unclassified Jannaschia]GIT89937.1 hypothetical protein JANAI61_03950 [Jannaschia sp. AI_61]GIT93956.1 hypothetical protein JANAI62_05790 [Jannaschia sp. AI_62]